MSIESGEIAVYPFQSSPILASHGAPVVLPTFSRSPVVSVGRKPMVHSYARKICVQQLVELQASVLAKKTALVMGEVQMSYGELNGRANQVAQHLQRMGVRPDVCVGICLESPPDLVIAQLAVLKAGGAYVLLNPADAPQRLANIVTNSRMFLLLTQECLLERLPANITSTMCMDVDGALFATYDTENPLPATSLEHLAYVSSATPSERGAVTHMELMNLVNWYHRSFAVSADACVTRVTDPARAVADWEIWPYLAIGSTLRLLEKERRWTPHLLQDWLLANAITHAFLPARLAESLLALAWPEQTSLRYLFTSVDMLYQHPVVSLPFALVIL